MLSNLSREKDSRKESLDRIAGAAWKAFFEVEELKNLPQAPWQDPGVPRMSYDDRVLCISRLSPRKVLVEHQEGGSLEILELCAEAQPWMKGRNER